MLIASQIVAPEFTNPLSLAQFEAAATKTLVARLGLVRYLRSPAGFFDLLPMGQLFVDQVVHDLSAAARRASFQKVSFSPVQPAALMAASRRLERFTEDVYRLPEHVQEVLLSPTHEEYVLDLFRSLGLRRAKSLPVSVFTVDTVIRRKRHRSTSGLAWTPVIPGFMTYSIALSISELRTVGEIILDAFRNLFERLRLPVMEIEREPDFTDLVIDSDYGRESILVCRNGHLTPSGEESCSICDTDIAGIRALSMAMYFITDNSMARALNYQVQASGQLVHPFLSTAGLGLSRTLMMTVHHNRTPTGMRWPNGFAPIKVAVIPERDIDFDTARQVASALSAQSSSIMLDDRLIDSGRRSASLQQVGVPLKLEVAGGGKTFRLLDRDTRLLLSANVPEAPVELARQLLARL